MSYKITLFESQQVTTGGIPKEYTLQELSDKLLKPSVGKKLGSGFVRCECLMGERNNNDDNITPSNLLIIDGDSATDGGDAPRPDRVHKRLKKEGINHVIYTTHSHWWDDEAKQIIEGKNKFRVLIPCTETYTIQELYANNEAASKLCSVQHVSEMDTYSQIWFLPRVDEKAADLFEKYEYYEGNDWEVIHEEKQAEETKKPEESSSEGNPTPLKELYGKIKSGDEYHESMRNISYQLAKDGVSLAHAKQYCLSLMETSEQVGTERWQKRVDELDRLVEGAYNKTDDNFSFAGIAERKGSSEVEIPRPPGMLGDLYDAAYDSMLYQYHEVALVNTLGLISGIAGRKFNVVEPEATGLNLYMTVVAPTGFGKSGIGKWFNMILRSGLNGKVKSHPSFLGPSNITGDKAIHNAIVSARSRVFISGEAGLLLQVKSGNPQGKMAFLLDAYGNSHRDGYTGESIYSSAENSLTPLRAPAISMISESTMDNLAAAYNQVGALESGYLPRQSMFHVTERNVDVNEHATFDMDHAVIDRLNQILETCSAVQALDDPDPHEIRFEPEQKRKIMAFIRECNIASRDADNRIKQAMFTRMAVKAIRYAGIATVFNKCKDSDKCLIIEAQELDWAIRLVRYEMDTIGEALGYMSSNEMQEAIRDVCVKITHMIENKASNKDAYIGPDMRQKKVIPIYGLAKYCATSKYVKALSDNGRGYAYKEGLDKVIDYMVINKAVARKDINPANRKKQNCIQLLENFNDFCKLYD